MLWSENHFKEHRYRTLEHEYENARANELREENAWEKVSGVTYTPLLLGHIQFGILTSVHLLLIYYKLTTHNVIFFTYVINISKKVNPIGINALIKILCYDKHSNEAEDMQSLNKEQQLKFKFFYPRFLSAKD